MGPIFLAELSISFSSISSDSQPRFPRTCYLEINNLFNYKTIMIQIKFIKAIKVPYEKRYHYLVIYKSLKLLFPLGFRGFK